jgi:hypothetical protein
MSQNASLLELLAEIQSGKQVDLNAIRAAALADASPAPQRVAEPETRAPATVTYAEPPMMLPEEPPEEPPIRLTPGPDGKVNPADLEALLRAKVARHIGKPSAPPRPAQMEEEAQARGIPTGVAQVPPHMAIPGTPPEVASMIAPDNTAAMLLQQAAVASGVSPVVRSEDDQKIATLRLLQSLQGGAGGAPASTMPPQPQTAPAGIQAPVVGGTRQPKNEPKMIALIPENIGELLDAVGVMLMAELNRPVTQGRRASLLSDGILLGITATSEGYTVSTAIVDDEGDADEPPTILMSIPNVYPDDLGSAVGAVVGQTIAKVYGEG